MRAVDLLIPRRSEEASPWLICFSCHGFRCVGLKVFSAVAWDRGVDDPRIVSAIVFGIKNGLRWRDAPPNYGPHKTIYNRFVRWSRLGVFNKIFAELAGKGGKPERIMIDATHLKAHRTAASLLKKGLFPDVSGAPKAA